MHFIVNDYHNHWYGFSGCSPSLNSSVSWKVNANPLNPEQQLETR